jgi:hypothetical protein
MATDGRREKLMAIGLAVLALATTCGRSTTQRHRPPRVLGSTFTSISLGIHPYPGLDSLAADTSARQQAIGLPEQLVGRRFDLDREFYLWDASFPGEYDRWSASQGRTLVLSWSAKKLDGTPILWRTIAAGSLDAAVIIPKARALKAFGKKVFLAFDHEPEARIKTNGTPTEFVAAWRHVVDVFRREGVTNVTWTWILEDISFWTGASSKYFPGDTYIDWIGVDGYNWYDCRSREIAPWRSWSAIFGSARAFGAAHPTKPIMVAEFGSVEDAVTPGRKGAWISDARQTLKRREWSQVQAVIYYNRDARMLDSGARCDWTITTSPSSEQAFATMAQDSYF